MSQFTTSSLSCAIAVILFSSFTPSANASPEIPGARQSRPIAITHATVHPVHRGPLEDATVYFENGKLTQIGKDVQLPPETEILDATGKHVYPGLFNTDGSLGLIEINSVRATDDRGEVGSINPNVRAEVAINPDSELIPVTRSGGVLLNMTTPERGLIPGMSAILQLDGWTTEDLTLHAPSGMHITWPGLSESDHLHDHGKDTKNHNKQLDKIEAFFVQAEAYHAARTADPSLSVDLRLEAMRGVLAGEVPLIASATRAASIQSAVAFASRRNLKLIIYGGADAEECASLLNAQRVPVIVNGVYRLPMRRHSAYDRAYTLPARLHAKRVAFCISGHTRFNATNIRNLPYHAAMAVAFGLPRDEALKAITLSPAKILGVADRVGSLETGKDATLIVTDGDLFNTATNVVVAYIQGRKVELSDRHKRLYRKYEARQAQLKSQ